MESLFLLVADALIEERIYFLVDKALAHDEGCRLADVAGNPATTQLFSNRCCGTAATEEITDKVAFVGRCLDNTLEESFVFLGGVVKFFLGHCIYSCYIPSIRRKNFIIRNFRSITFCRNHCSFIIQSIFRTFCHQIMIIQNIFIIKCPLVTF